MMKKRAAGTDSKRKDTKTAKGNAPPRRVASADGNAKDAVKPTPIERDHDADESFQSARRDIRDSGLRATPARAATLKLLRVVSTPLSHAEVADHLASIGVDQATAFRNLNDLTDAGLVRRSELGDHVWRFEAIDRSESGGHPHFVCVDCGTVTCLQTVQLTARSQRASADVGEVTEILLRGHCNDCR